MKDINDLQHNKVYNRGLREPTLRISDTAIREITSKLHMKTKKSVVQTYKKSENQTTPCTFSDPNNSNSNNYVIIQNKNKKYGINPLKKNTTQLTQVRFVNDSLWRRHNTR